MRYVALLRGIGPTNPNMHGHKLKAVFESLGFTNVHPVIASGNVIFNSPSKSAKQLEAKIEEALPKKLGFTSMTIIRSKLELERLVKKNPYKGVKDEKPNYLLVTFFKNRRPELCSMLNVSAHTPDFMRGLEKEHTKAITSRTWKTVHRILKKMEESKN
jgi:uncharacterized protein (DUF1697 family)